MFKAIPNYLIIPNITLFFMVIETGLATLTTGAFSYYFLVVRNLNNEVNKTTESFLTLDELSSSLILVSGLVRVLNQKETEQNLPEIGKSRMFFKNGDIIFRNAVFSYPKRPHQDILKNLSFCFEREKFMALQGKIALVKVLLQKPLLNYMN
jgi:ABC-type multidrug transport system fused ATPase/permease subunit